VRARRGALLLGQRLVVVGASDCRLLTGATSNLLEVDPLMDQMEYRQDIKIVEGGERYTCAT
jgi:hypothetical protein